MFLKLAENQFKENRIVGDFARQMNMPIRKLSTEVKEVFGKSPLNLLHDLLGLEIKRLLFIENLTQKEISYFLNFDSPASYTRFVNNHFNCNPTELKSSLN